MKLNKIFLVALAGLSFAACSDITDCDPESGTILVGQLQQVNNIAPERKAAVFNGLFAHVGYPAKMYSAPDDWGILTIGFCNDLEGADALIADNNYNWFSVCGEYSSRNADYRNPYIRYRAPYNLIGDCNNFIKSNAEATDAATVASVAQAKTLRAYAYLRLAPGYAFVTDKSSLAVPLVTEEEIDFTNNPRATVQEIYDQIFADLDWAYDHIGDAKRATKMDVNKAVVLGLRARANLDMQNWAAAAADAKAAFDAGTNEGFRVATMDELSRPSFYDLSEKNWIWGYDNNVDVAKRYIYAGPTAWIRSFPGESYSAGTGTYTCINTLLYNKIPESDVRKGWWVNEYLESPLIEGLTWPGEGVENSDNVALAFLTDVKMPFDPYTNVKFGCYTVGTTENAEDFPLMRMEEMILIQAEAYAHDGKDDQALTLLNDFVKTYRDPEYDASSTGLTLLDEIWKQRRIELWGEGFGIYDTKRLGKPLVRFHGPTNTTNQPSAFAFNMAANDGWLLMRFPQGEMNTNFKIVDNTAGEMPKQGQNGDLRDGVTD